MKQIRYALEALLLYSFYALCWVLPLDWASGLGGWIGRTIGPHLAASRKAKRHLAEALPEFSDKEQNKVIKEMWDNLGRTIAEYPHLEKIATERVDVINGDLVDTYQKQGKPAVLIGMHLANWEISAPTFFKKFDVPMTFTYRAPNNPWVDRLLQKARTFGGRIKGLPKARESGKDLIQTVKDGGYLGIYIDQKYNQGIMAPFFGKPAKTNSVFVSLAQKYKCPLLCVQNIRTGGAHFEMRISEDISLFDGKNPRPQEDVVINSHQVQEKWVKEHPSQWIWLHKRWDSKETGTEAA